MLGNSAGLTTDLAARAHAAAVAIRRPIEARLTDLPDGRGQPPLRRRPRRAPPRVKPRAFYGAVHAYQRARIIRARIQDGSRGWRGVRILGYHRVTDANDVFAVTPDRFRSQMDALVSSDAIPVRLDAAIELLEKPVTDRYVAVTFDDGFHDVLENAMPVLREFGIPATIFVCSAVISGEATYDWYREPPPVLSWAEIQDLVKDPLVDIQAHSRTHPRLPMLPEAEAWGEILGSKQDIEMRLDYELTSFCYPAGLYGAREVELVRRAGYRASVTTKPGVNAAGAPLGELRRTMIGYRDTRSDFEAKMAGLLDRPSTLQRRVHDHRARGKADA